MATTTADAIRDRMIAVIGQLAPSLATEDKFRAFKNEDEGDLVAFCEANPTGQVRRYQVIFGGFLGLPEVSNSDFEARQALFTATVCYPHTARYGAGQALDRHKVIERDEALLEKSIGLYGRANFTSPTYPDACCVGWSSRRVSGDACDYLVADVTMLFNRVIG